MHSQDIRYRHHDEFTFRELVDALWQTKWLVLVLSVAFAVVTTVAALAMPQTYESTITVSPVSEAPGSGQLSALGGLATQFGGLASLAGLSVGGDSKKAESLAVLQSRALTNEYIRQNNLLPVLYADQWDAKNNRWDVSDQSSVPTLWEANEKFKKIRTVSTDNKTGLVTLTIAWTDPKAAADWANDLVKMTNDYLRTAAIEESERNIAYLREQATKTDIVGVKQAIYSILQTEINKAMLARGSDQYALKIIDPAVPPESPSSPNVRVWALAGLFGGLMLSLLIAVIGLAWRKSSEAPSADAHSTSRPQPELA
jgi:uncharacterized protein involved in exopolysaccharide biosynthesis